MSREQANSNPEKTNKIEKKNRREHKILYVYENWIKL